jgi:hypothetical protein
LKWADDKSDYTLGAEISSSAWSNLEPGRSALRLPSVKFEEAAIGAAIRETYSFSSGASVGLENSMR